VASNKQQINWEEDKIQPQNSETGNKTTPKQAKRVRISSI